MQNEGYLRWRDLPTRTNEIVSGLENMACTVLLPSTMRLATNAELELHWSKLLAAKTFIRHHPFARAANARLRIHFRNCAKVAPIR